MPEQPFTWQPSEIYTVTNATRENFLLELESGRLRLDAGHSIRLTGDALQHPQVMELSKAGKLQVEKFNWRKRKDAKR